MVRGRASGRRLAFRFTATLVVCLLPLLWTRWVPCSPRYHGWAGPRGCGPCWGDFEPMTPLEWLRLQRFDLD